MVCSPRVVVGHAQLHDHTAIVRLAVERQVQDVRVFAGGVPNGVYHLQDSTNLITWRDFLTNAAGPLGTVVITNNGAWPALFFRALYLAPTNRSR